MGRFERVSALSATWSVPIRFGQFQPAINSKNNKPVGYLGRTDQVVWVGQGIFKWFLLTSLIVNVVATHSIDCSNGFYRCKKSPTKSQALLPSPQKAETLVFAEQRLAVVYPVIQKFKSIITSDPLGITKSWVGSNICKYRGFYCENPLNNLSAIALASMHSNGFQLSTPMLDNFLDRLPDIALFHANSNNFTSIISPNISTRGFLLT